MPLPPVAGLSDLHVHSQFSCDGRSTMEAICHRAVALGLDSIAFTDHVDLEPADEGFGFFQPAAYLAEVERCRALFAGRLTILSGVEIGEVHRFSREAATLLDGYPLDLVIGSLHWVDGALVFDRAYFEGRPADDAYRAYLAELVPMCRHGGFDILGHLDIVKREGALTPGAFSIEPYEDEVRAVLEILVDQGIGLEINTSTLRRPVNQTSPAGTVLGWYRELGGELLTLGSDAHQVDHLAAGFATAVELARAAGFRHFTVYIGRQARFYPLEVLQ
jgi:histidinol-phosphatase (PHP family)